MDEYFRIANLGVAAMMAVGGFAQFFAAGGHFVTGLGVLLLAAATGFLEFQIPPQLVRYCSFYFSFLGRGVFYVFIASVMMQGILGVIAGWLVTVVGLGYVALEFVQSVEPPPNMRDQDAGWGAEGV